MDYKILFKGKLINIKRNNNEPEQIFIKRVDFILTSLIKNYKLDDQLLTKSDKDVEISTSLLTLSFCYKNMIQYGVEYDADTHSKIEKILEGNDF
jgi:hypothetical protein